MCIRDRDMVSDAFVGTLKKSLTEGKVTEEAINVACRRILEAKYLSLIHILRPICVLKARSCPVW